MNENSQLDAMAAELAAEGFMVQRDVVAKEFSELEDLGVFTLDLVGKKAASTDDAPVRPAMIIVEIANRQQRGRMGGPNVPARREVVEDWDAVERFNLISEVVAGRSDIHFEIRFLDVSADQAAARRVDGAAVRTNEKLAALIIRDTAILASVSAKPAQIRAIVVARLWSHWLRMVAYRFPARDRRELKAADLRTIQKDLYDQKVVTMSPRKYLHAHAALLSVTEGGDVDCERLLKLEPQLEELWAWARSHAGLSGMRVESSDATLFDKLSMEVRALPDSDRRSALETHLVNLQMAWDAPIYSVQLALFQRELGRVGSISEESLDALIGHAAEQALGA